MAFKIITGAEGSGKTKKIFNDMIASSMADPDRRHIVITPEQNTLAAEKRIIDAHERHVLLNIDVLSFNRLVYRLFEAHDLKPPVVISETGKNMLLRKCAAEVADELSIYAKSVKKNGFSGKLASIASESFSYSVTPEDLRKAGEKVSSDMLRAKLHDLSIILEQFISAREEHKITHEELLEKGYGILCVSDYFKGANVVLDGFTGFTPMQYAFIGEILKKADSVTVSLSVTGDEDLYGNYEDHELFAIIKETFKSLSKTAEKYGIKPVHEVFSDEPDVDRADELKVLSSSFLRRKTPSFELPAESAIRVYSCLSSTKEAEFVAGEINRLVFEEGLKYSDIAIASGNLETDAPIIKSIFKKYDIPFFIDLKSNLKDTPLSRFTLAALEAASKNFTYESVMRFIRCGLNDLSFSEKDELDNYVFALGIRGAKKWGEPFTVAGYKNHYDVDLDLINDARSRAVGGLLAFDKALKGAKTGKDAAEGLRGLYEAYNVEERLAKIAEEFEKDGKNEDAAVYRQIFEKFSEMIDEFEKLFSDEKIGAEMFSSVISSAVSDMTAGLIPQSLDEVHVGDVIRSRRGYIKVLFIINFNDGIIPSAPAGAGLLNDSDREALKRAGLTLAPTDRQKLFEEQFYIYQLLCAPTKYLYFTYSLIDQSGNSLVRSSYLRQVEACFKGGITEKRFRKDDTGIYSVSQYLGRLSDELSPETADDPYLKQLYSILISLPSADKARLIADGAFFRYDGTLLSKETVDAVYGDKLYAGVSGLETQSKCPYSYYLGYILGLKERTEYEFTAFDRGNYFHKALEEIFDNIIKDGIDISELTVEQIGQIEAAALIKARKELKTLDFSETGKGKYLLGRWERMIKKAVLAIMIQFAEGKYVPEKVEFNFDFKDAPSLRVELSCGKEMLLRGKVDRVDVYEVDDNVFVRIVDYKTSGHDIKEKEIESGLKLQLLEYMNAVTDIFRINNPDKNIRKGAALYFDFSDKYEKSDGEAADISNLYKPTGYSVENTGGADNLQKNSILSPARFSELCQKTAEKIKEIGEDIASGKISKAPFVSGSGDACTYCPFRNSCGFDADLSGYGFRRIK